MNGEANDAERWSLAAPAVQRRILEDLQVWCDRDLDSGEVSTFAAPASVAGQDCVHVAFRFELFCGSLTGQGAWLIPWRQAARLAGWYEHVDEARMEALLSSAAPSPATKVTLLEFSGVVAAATESALAQVGLAGLVCTPDGCQGVAAGKRPKLEVEQGTLLWISRQVHEWEPGERFAGLMVLPELAVPEVVDELEQG